MVITPQATNVTVPLVLIALIIVVITGWLGGPKAVFGVILGIFCGLLLAPTWFGHTTTQLINGIF